MYELDLDSLDFEEFEDFDDGEGEMDDFDDADDDEDYDDFDGEDDLFGEYAAEGRRSRSRRRRARARMRRARRKRQLARRRRGRRRGGRTSRPRTSRGKIANNRAQIKKVGLESAVKSDMLASGLKTQDKRIGGTENAITATKVIDEIRTQFPNLNNNKFIKTGLPLAPLLFLKPPKKKEGLEGFAMDPRIWGPVLAAGAALYQEFKRDDNTPAKVVFNVGDNITVPNGTRLPLVAEVQDKNGKEVEGRTLEYESSDKTVATVDKANGTFAAKGAGSVIITAKDKDLPKVVGFVFVTVPA